MRVVMLKTLSGSPDGIRVMEYFKGQEYDLSGDLAANFLGQKACECLVKASAPEVGELGKGPEAKAAPAPSKNKAVKGGKSNKGA